MRTSISKTITILMLLVSLSINNTSQANNFLGIWTRVADFGGTARQFAVGFSIDTLGYLGLGADSAGLPKNFWSYSPATDSWSMIDSIFDFYTNEYISRTSATSFSYDSEAYVGLGRDSSNFNYDLYKYDQPSQTWTPTNQFLSGPPRTQAVGFVIGKFGYITTGVGASSAYYNDIIKYDIANVLFDTLNPGNTLPSARYAATGFSLNGYGYMGLGVNDSTYFNDFWKYDPIAEAWTQEADFGGTPRFGAVSFTSCGYGYVGLGEDLNSSYRQDVWQYNDSNNSWTFVNHFPGTGRRNAVAFVVNNVAYIGTGWDANGRTKDFYSFTCDSTTGINSIEQNNASATLLPNPNNGNFDLIYDLNGSPNALLSLTDLTGRTVATYQLSSSKSKQTINQSTLNNGIYFYSIIANEKTISFGKFSVVH